MGPPDLESIQEGAPGDTQIIHFGQDPICVKITPLRLSTLHGNPLSTGNSHSSCMTPAWQLPIYHLYTLVP